MVIELERSLEKSDDEAADMGIPACEDMQLGEEEEEEENTSSPRTPTPQTVASSLKEEEFRLKLNESSTPKKKEKAESESPEKEPSVDDQGTCQHVFQLHAFLDSFLELTSRAQRD
jgi:hypothetical protein